MHTLFRGEVMHARLAPARHEFTYPFTFHAYDVGALPELARRSWWFGHNARRPLSIWDEDYLRPGPGDLLGKVRELAAERGHHDVTSAWLVTNPRHLGYVFNPFSIFYAMRADGSVACAIAEVRNTYREKHLYVLDGAQPDERGQLRFRAKKELFVSPFSTLRGDYEFRLSPPGEALDIRIDLVENGAPVLVTRLRGQGLPLSGGALARTLARWPFSALLSMPRIWVQAWKLRRGKRLKDHLKPRPTSAMSFPT